MIGALLGKSVWRERFRGIRRIFTIPADVPLLATLEAGPVLHLDARDVPLHRGAAVIDGAVSGHSTGDVVSPPVGSKSLFIRTPHGRTITVHIDLHEPGLSII